MPELPEVETIVRGLRPHLIGAVIRDVTAGTDRLRAPVSLPALREACCGRRVLGIARRAKYILVDLGPGSGLLLHLGMTGAFRVVPETAPKAPEERVSWHLADGRRWGYLDVRRLGSVEVCALPADGTAPEALAGLGPEPLGEGFDGGLLYAATRGRRSPIKSLLLDQTLIAGVGNIYASEALFRAGIRPQRPGGRLGRAACDRLAAAVRGVLDEAIAAGGTTIDDFRAVDGSAGRFAVRLCVYGRAGEHCPRCGKADAIRRIVQSGRSTFFCRYCQR